MSSEDHQELSHFCAEVGEHREGGLIYILLKSLRLQPGCEPSVVDALLCLGARDGYATRLFLSKQVTAKDSKAQNWNTFQILSRSWFCWSWKDVSASQRPAEILVSHLRAFA